MPNRVSPQYTLATITMNIFMNITIRPSEDLRFGQNKLELKIQTPYSAIHMTVLPTYSLVIVTGNLRHWESILFA